MQISERPLLLVFLHYSHGNPVYDLRAPVCLCASCLLQDCSMCVGDGRSVDPTDDSDDVRALSGYTRVHTMLYFYSKPTVIFIAHQDKCILLLSLMRH